ncbi:Hpt domain-containing protein [Sulfitobacter sp. F26169L]|uniref:Hpt domain-containing protein n=1 Tax=Sulfitobacter sp. F26169L TaxID=2996015 RepID=UPI002260B8EC|nr:Hpt domain-containing protein [Sulfitobacter sp. F26169L]MCX7565911.1 Hpt domain-containing protein [Sulfitobacter sp. F26169L]
MIDWKRIKTLRNEIGEESFPEVVDIFIEEVSEMISNLRDAPQTETLGEDLHALKGSALNLGFTMFADLCQSGENRAADGRAEDISLAPILQCYEDSKDVFLAGLQNGKAA